MSQSWSNHCHPCNHILTQQTQYSKLCSCQLHQKLLGKKTDDHLGTQVTYVLTLENLDMLHKYAAGSKYFP